MSSAASPSDRADFDVKTQRHLYHFAGGNVNEWQWAGEQSAFAMPDTYLTLGELRTCRPLVQAYPNKAQ